jgi:hypothetical protein
MLYFNIFLHHFITWYIICKQTQSSVQLSVRFFLLLVGWDQVPRYLATSGLLYKPQMIDEDDCGAIGGMQIGRGNQSTRRKLAPAPLCPPQIPHDQTRARTPGRRGGKPATISVRFLVSLLLLHVLLPLLHGMFRSRKDHRQMCTLLHANCYSSWH